MNLHPLDAFYSWLYCGLCYGNHSVSVGQWMLPYILANIFSKNGFGDEPLQFTMSMDANIQQLFKHFSKCYLCNLLLTNNLMEARCLRGVFLLKHRWIWVLTSSKCLWIIWHTKSSCASLRSAVYLWGQIAINYGKLINLQHRKHIDY